VEEQHTVFCSAVQKFNNITRRCIKIETSKWQ